MLAAMRGACMHRLGDGLSNMFGEVLALDLPTPLE